MKKTISLLSLLQIFFFASIAQTNVIDSIKVIPKNITVSDSVLFAMYAHPFGGSCTHQLKVDSIIDTKIYISGKFDSDNKCGALWDKEVSDTICIGLFSVGTYEIIYTFMDITTSSYIRRPTEIYNTVFDVSSLKVSEVKINNANLYPNPCDTYVNISFSDNNNEIRNIQLFDALGKMIYEKNMNQNTLQINMNAYNQGIYFVRIESNDGVANYKIIKK